MSYQRIVTPKVYIDNLSWLLSSGHISSSDLTSSGLNFASGYSATELFDMKPSNLQIITANGLSTPFELRINTRTATNSEQDSNFIAILGHNFKEAGAKFSLQIDDDSAFGSPDANTTTALTDVVNADALSIVDTGTNLAEDLTTSETDVSVESGHGSRFSTGDILQFETAEGNLETVYVTAVNNDVLTVVRGFNGSTQREFDSGDDIYFYGYTRPAQNGWTLATFTQTSDNQYIRLLIDPDGGNTDTFSSDIKIGAILVGETYSLPQAPDLEIEKQFLFDGVKKQTSVGGQTYATSTYTKGSNWFLEPFFNSATATSPDKRHKSGRLSLDMSFSYLADTNLYPSNLHGGSNATSDSFFNNVISKTNGGMFPMLFQYDGSTATDVDSFLWCRLANNPSFEQVAINIWNTSMSLIEEF